MVKNVDSHITSSKVRASDQPNGHIGNIPFYNTDLECLLNDNYLNDAIIDCYMHVIREKYTDDDHDFYSIDCITSKKILEYCSAPDQALLLKLSKWKAIRAAKKCQNEIHFVVNEGQSHWILLVIYIPRASSSNNRAGSILQINFSFNFFY